MYVNIAVLKDAYYGTRAALDPNMAEKLARQGAKIAVQSGAWSYEQLSGLVFHNIRFTRDVDDLVGDADIVLSVGLPAPEILEAMQENAVLVTLESPQDENLPLESLLQRRLTTIVADRVPSEAQRQALKESSGLARFIASMVKDSVLDPDWEDQSLSGLLFTHQGQIRRQMSDVRCQMTRAG